MKKARSGPVEAAESLAIQALTYIAADGARLGRFLAETGIGPDRIRAAAREPHFLAGVLAHLSNDELLLTEFSNEIGIAPAEVVRARAALGDPDWEREVP